MNVRKEENGDVIVDKPWGSERITYQDHHYITKILTINPGERSSLQYHISKTETVIVLSGKLILHKLPSKNASKETEISVHERLEHFTFAPMEIHRLEASIEGPVLLLECSTNHLNDVVRLSDDYSRS